MTKIVRYYYNNGNPSTTFNGVLTQSDGSFIIPENVRIGCTRVYALFCGGGGGGSGASGSSGAWGAFYKAAGGGGGSGQLRTAEWTTPSSEGRDYWNRYPEYVSWTIGNGGKGGDWKRNQGSDKGLDGGSTNVGAWFRNKPGVTPPWPYTGEGARRSDTAFGGQGGRGAVTSWDGAQDDGKGGVGGMNYSAASDVYMDYTVQSTGVSNNGYTGGSGGPLPGQSYMGMSVGSVDGGRLGSGRNGGAGRLGTGGGGGVWMDSVPAGQEDGGDGGNGGKGWMTFCYDIIYHDVSSSYDSNYVVVSGTGEYLNGSNATVSIRAKTDSDPGMNHSHERFRVKVGGTYYYYDPSNPTAFSIPNITFNDITEDKTINIITELAVFHTVVYNGGTGYTGGSTASTIIWDYNSGNTNVTLAANGFTKTNYHFRGWKIEGDDVLYDTGDAYPIAANSFKTATAQWAPDQPTPPGTYTGFDGIEYTIKNTTLDIEGEGMVSSLVGGNLALADGTSISISGIDSAVVGSGITELNSGSLDFGTGDDSLRIVTFNSSPVDNTGVLDGDYSALVITADGTRRFRPGTYVLMNGVWKDISDSPFILVLDSNGGSYAEATEELTTVVIPQVKVASCGYRDSKGKMNTVPVPSSYVDYKEFVRHLNPEGEEIMIFPILLSDCTEITLHIKDLPSTLQGGNGTLIPPSGFDNISAWEVQTPYHEMVYKAGAPHYPSGTNYFTIKLTRATKDDNVCHAIATPFWIPSREDRLRAIVTASGLGSLDFGNVQAVSETYNASLTTIPIVCRGFTGTYCMDLGVTKSVTINYLRVSPDDPDNTSTDSRLWDNATWQKKLREFQDRWQLMTNGCSLYLKRPDNPRLANGDDTDHDPMVDYIEEINGENCYIQSAPISLGVGKPHSMQSSISLKMGTLYPKQELPNTITVRYVWLDNNGDMVGDREFYVTYPTDKVAVVPTLPATWTPYTLNNNTVYAVDWAETRSNGSNILVPNTHFVPSRLPTVSGNEATVYARVQNRDSAKSTRICLGGQGGVSTWSFSIYADTTGTSTATLYMWCIGAGGGGGGGCFCSKYQYIPGANNDATGGGGGGASGEYTYNNHVFIGSMDLYCVTGAGGSGGIGKYDDTQAGHGNDGGDTKVFIGSTEVEGNRLAIAYGGWGGVGAHHAKKPGEATRDRDYPGHIWPPTSYSGGAGGGAYGIDALDWTGSAWNNSGQNGNGGNNNGGAGGTAAEYEYSLQGDQTKVFCGGGGGGGGCKLITDATGLDNVSGGKGYYYKFENNNYLPASVQNGGYGCGGGGGLPLVKDDLVHVTEALGNGGTGGNGAIYLVVENGEFQ